MSSFPEEVYVQHATNKEVVVNRSKQGAVSRYLGPNNQAGQYVAVYKLDRIVGLQAGLTIEEVPLRPTGEEQEQQPISA